MIYSIFHQDSSYEWLEDVSGEMAMSWVRDQNDRTTKNRDIENSEMYKRVLSVLDSKEKIPYIKKIGNYWYNFWQDDTYVRGLWRRLPYKLLDNSMVDFHEYLKTSPAWESVLDLDALATKENVSWVWKHHYILLQPTEDRVLLHLSPGGSDATVVREFDLESKSFITKEEGGFYVPEAKTNIDWRTKDTVFIGTKFEEHEEDGLTDSGYPRVVKEWKRGTPLSEAKLIFDGNQEDVNVQGSRDTWAYSDGTINTIDWISQATSFYTEDNYIIDKESGDLIKLLLPDDVEVSSYWDTLLVKLKSPWKHNGGIFEVGSLLRAKINEVVNLSKQIKTRNSIEMADLFQPLFEPSSTTSLKSYITTKNFVVLYVLDNLKPHLIKWKYEAPEKWTKEQESKDGSNQESFDTLYIRAVDRYHTDDAFVTVESFTKPSTLYYSDKINEITVGKKYGIELKKQPSFFQANGIETEQRWVASKDGTKIPYFLIGKDLSLKSHGPRKTLLYGYGGFEVSLLPFYSGTIGAAWLEKGGVYALSNIRGGGEFGPKWHQAALKENRQRAYEDFEAIADDLIDANVTTSTQLGCMGGSNGGLLVGNMLVREGSNDRFGAIVCQVPLLDMRRYHTLLAGASWMAEYGDPDKPKEWNWIKEFSPFHMIKKGATYPRVLFTTSTKDDRVHPAHARKMVAKLQDYANDETAKNVWYYENIEGGHGGAANNKQKAFMKTLEYQFLWNNLESKHNPLSD